MARLCCSKRIGVRLILLMLILSMPVSADYEIVWSTIDSGGGRSSDGSYELYSSIGQPIAGIMKNESYEIIVGFSPLNFPCIVNLELLYNLSLEWLVDGTDLSGDLDGSGLVDLADFSLLAAHWLDNCPEDWF